MQRNYLVKAPINFADFGFFVRVGDILVHDTSNNNRLTIYRNGEIVKSISQTPLGISALVKNQFIVDVNSVPQPVIVKKPVVSPKKPDKIELKPEAKAENKIMVEGPPKDPENKIIIEKPEKKEEAKKAKEEAKDVGA